MRVSILAALVLIASVAFAQQPGTLDTTFAVGGKLVLENETGGVVEIASLQDGKMLLMIYRGDTTRILRRFENGDADNAFAGEGVLVRPWKAERMLIDSDERIYLIGNTMVDDEMQGIVQRFLPTGDLDTSYGAAGSVNITFTDTIDFTILFKDADIYPDGRLVICGDRSSNIKIPGSIRACVFRLTSTGILDDSFMSGGYTIIYGSMNQCSNYRITCPRIELGLLGEIYFTRHRRNVNVCTPGPIPRSLSLYRIMPDSLNFQEVLIFWTSDVDFRPGEVVTNIGGYTVCGVRYFGPIDKCFDQYLNPAISINYPLSNLQCSPWYTRAISDDQGRFYHVGRCSNPSRIVIHRSTTFNRLSDPEWSAEEAVTYDGAYVTDRSGLSIQTDGKLLVGGFQNMDGVDRPIVLRYHNISDPQAKLELKVNLGGPFNAITGQMKDELRSSDLIPLQDPYTTSGALSVLSTYTHFIDPAVLETTGDSAVIDWIWLEALSLSDTSEIVAARAALLLSNGAVTALDGRSPVDMNCGAGQYHIRVRHRNHLSVTTADPIALGVEPIEVDLTSPGTPTFGTDAQMMIDSVMVMWPGNANGDGMVKYVGADNDRDPVLVAVGGTEPTAIANGYFNADINMDGTVKYVGQGNDRDIILQTIGGTVPTAIRNEQSP